MATSVPDPMATPMSAFLSAGASFTPSPVIATISPLACNASTMRNLCSGDTRAKTEVVRTAMRNVSLSICSSSRPVRVRPSGSVIPRSMAMARAVRGWSPVIMMGRIPAVAQRAMASRASERGGSTIPISPSSTSPCSVSSPFPDDGSSARPRAATARTRRPFSVIRSMDAPNRVRSASSSGRTRPPCMIRLQSSGIPSPAPLTRARKGAPSATVVSVFKRREPPSGVRCSVVMRFRVESNGTSPTRGSPESRSSLPRVNRSAASTRAPSVGSPTVSGCSDRRSRTASLHRAAAASRT